jgi:RecA-family ATPase
MARSTAVAQMKFTRDLPPDIEKLIEVDESESSLEPLPPIKWVDMSNWDYEPVPQQKWAVLNRVPLRQTALFSGEGAAGKSTLQLQLSVAHVLGKDWLGTLPEPGAAFFIDAEDDEDVMHWRLAAIAEHYGTTFSELISKGLRPLTLAGQDAVLAAAGKGGKMEPTTLYKQLLEAAGDIKPKMIGIASSANVYAGSEIDRSQVQQFISLLTRMAIAAEGSVVLISHPSLTGIATDTGLSGNTQWHNSVRARFYMKSMKPEAGEQPDGDLREIQFKKNNYGPVSESIVLRYQNGLFLPVAGQSSLEKVALESMADDVFLDLLARFAKENRNVSASPSKTYAPSVFVKEDEARKAGLTGKQLEAAMRRLFKADKIWNEPDGPPSKKRYRVAVK